LFPSSPLLLPPLSFLTFLFLMLVPDNFSINCQMSQKQKKTKSKRKKKEDEEKEVKQKKKKQKQQGFSSNFDEYEQQLTTVLLE
jgi:hypothetical protein